MIKNVEKINKNWYNVFVIIWVVVLFLLLFAYVYKEYIVSDKSIVKTSAGENNPVVVILDAGHGGVDGGAVAEDGTLEKDINLKISNKSFDFLSVMGYKVKAIRTDDRDISDESALSVRDKKRTDLKNRLNMLENSENGILLSVHQNKFSSESCSGTQVFYSGNNEKSLLLAESVQNTVKSFLQPENDRKVKASGDEIFILKNATHPAILVECGFISNKSELEKLKSDTYQSEISFAVVCGLMEYTTIN